MVVPVLQRKVLGEDPFLFSDAGLENPPLKPLDEEDPSSAQPSAVEPVPLQPSTSEAATQLAEPVPTVDPSAERISLATQKEVSSATVSEAAAPGFRSTSSRLPGPEAPSPRVKARLQAALDQTANRPKPVDPPATTVTASAEPEAKEVQGSSISVRPASVPDSLLGLLNSPRIRELPASVLAQLIEKYPTTA